MIANDFGLLCRLNMYHVSQISKKVIEILQNIHEPLLSGEDTGLTSTWEEICVQIQVEESIYWEMYEDLINSYIATELEKEDDAVKILISYMGSFEGSPIQEDGEEYVFFEQNAVRAIYSDVWSIAADFENKNIYRYINSDFDEEEEEEEEEEEDDDGENEA